MVEDLDSYDLYLNDDLEFPKQRHITNYRLFRYALKTNHDSASDDPRIVSTCSAMISPFEMGRSSWDKLEYTYELIGDLLPIHNRQGIAPKKDFLQRVTDYYVQLDATVGRSERTVWITTNREDGTKYKLVGDGFKHYSSRCMQAIKRMMATDLLSSNYLHDMGHDRAYRISNFSLTHLHTGTPSKLIKPPADYGNNYRLTGRMILSNSNSSKDGFLPAINVRTIVKGEYVIDFGRDAHQIPQFWLKHCDGGSKFVLEEPCHPDYQQLYDRAMNIDSYNWQTDPNNQDQVWRHITNYHLTDIKGNLHTLEINDDPDEVFILWGDLMPPEESNCPLLRTKLFVGCFNIDYGESIDDINRGLWMKSMENWYKLEKPSTDYRSIANSLCVKVQHFSELYDALIYLDEETCTYHEATGKYVCAFTIQEVQQRALSMGGKPFSMPFVRDNWVFIAQFLDAVLDWKHSTPLRRSIKDLRDENMDLQPQAHPDAAASLTVGAPSLVAALEAKGLSNSSQCSDGPSVVRMSKGVHGVHNTGSSSASNVVRVLDRTNNSSDKSSQQRNTSGGAAAVYTSIHTDRKPADLGSTASFDNTLHMRPKIQRSSANNEYPKPVVLGSKGLLNLQSNGLNKDKVRISEGKAIDYRSIARTISNESDEELFPSHARTTVASKIKRKAESVPFSSTVSEEGSTVQRPRDRSSHSEHHNTSISPVPSLHRSAHSIQGNGTLSRAVRENGAASTSVAATEGKRSADPSWETGRDKFTAKADSRDRYDSNRDRRLDDINHGKEDRPELRTFCRYCKCKEKKPKCRNEGHLDGCFYQLPHFIQRFDSGSQKYSNKSSYGGDLYQHKSRPLSLEETSVDVCGSKSSRAVEQAPWTKRSSADTTYHGQYTVMKEDNRPSVDHCLGRDVTNRTTNECPHVTSITPVDPKIVALNPSTINRPSFSEPLDVPLVKLGNAPRDPLVRHGARTTELGNGVYVTSKGSTGPRSPSTKSNRAPFSGSQPLGVAAPFGTQSSSATALSGSQPLVVAVPSGSQSSSAAALSGSQSSSATALSRSQPSSATALSGSQPSIVAPSRRGADSSKVRRVAWADMEDNGRLTSVCGD